MEETTLRSRTSPIANAVYLAFGALAVCGVIYGVSRSSLGGALLGGSIGCAIFMAWRSEQGNMQLGIDHYGLTIRASRSHVTVIPWSEIDKIAEAYVGSYSRGVYTFGGDQYLGIRLVIHSNLRASKACSDNRLLSEYDFLLSDSYGMPLKELERFLSQAKSDAQHA